MVPGNLYLLPNLIADTAPENVLPAYNLSLIKALEYFIVENPKNARRFLKTCGVPSPFDHLEFHKVDKKTDAEEQLKALMPLFKGNDMGLISEAGTPAIADPGSHLIQEAHKNGISVKPLSGPSSIFMALMASGLNGQSFTFHGYLPIKKNQREQQLKTIEKQALQTGYAQIFMETPYRNQAMVESILKSCHPQTMLCVACDISSPQEEILTLDVGTWKQLNKNFNKRKAIFLIGNA